MVKHPGGLLKTTPLFIHGTCIKMHWKCTTPVQASDPQIAMEMILLDSEIKCPLTIYVEAAVTLPKTDCGWICMKLF